MINKACCMIKEETSISRPQNNDINIYKSQHKAKTRMYCQTEANISMGHSNS